MIASHSATRCRMLTVEPRLPVVCPAAGVRRLDAGSDGLRVPLRALLLPGPDPHHSAARFQGEETIPSRSRGHVARSEREYACGTPNQARFQRPAGTRLGPPESTHYRARPEAVCGSDRRERRYHSRDTQPVDAHRSLVRSTQLALRRQHARPSHRLRGLLLGHAVDGENLLLEVPLKGDLG